MFSSKFGELLGSFFDIGTSTGGLGGELGVWSGVGGLLLPVGVEFESGFVGIGVDNGEDGNVGGVVFMPSWSSF